MTYSIFIWLLILFCALWTVAMSFLVFSFLTLKRYQKMMRFIAVRLEGIERRLPLSPSLPKTDTPSKKKTPDATADETKQFVISKDEPLSKYADVSLPESVRIDFVDTRS